MFYLQNSPPLHGPTEVKEAGAVGHGGHTQSWATPHLHLVQQPDGPKEVKEGREGRFPK